MVSPYFLFRGVRLCFLAFYENILSGTEMTTFCEGDKYLCHIKIYLQDVFIAQTDPGLSRRQRGTPSGNAIIVP
jgi:hypothetical protein